MNLSKNTAAARSLPAGVSVVTAEDIEGVSNPLPTRRDTEATVMTPPPTLGAVAENLPDLILDTMEMPSPLNPLGAKGIGELPTVAAPAAVANAVMDAWATTGVRHLTTLA